MLNARHLLFVEDNGRNVIIGRNDDILLNGEGNWALVSLILNDDVNGSLSSDYCLVDVCQEGKLSHESGVFYGTGNGIGLNGWVV